MRNVGERASSLLAGLNRMRAGAAARSIPPEELRGATITLSNFGMIAGHFAGLVVVPPQVAIAREAIHIDPRFSKPIRKSIYSPRFAQSLCRLPRKAAVIADMIFRL